jgi:homoserine dehydrogenase
MTNMQQVRAWVVGLGTVGRWLLRALESNADRLASRHGIAVTVVGAANARDGLIYDGDGLPIRELLGLLSEGRSIAELPDVDRWRTTIDGLRATEADVLVEVSASPSDSGEPGVTHMREALTRGIPVVTSNKWPVALYGVELAELARRQSVAFRAESTVMSGTPVLGPLVDGLAGAVPVGLRGILNATANFILCRMAQGSSYDDALAEAQRSGLAERDPSADVDGHDSVAKLMVLAGLVFGRQLHPHQVARRGITELTAAELEQAATGDARLKHVATLEFAGPDGAGEVSVGVEPMPLRADDALAGIDGTSNAIVLRARPVGQVTIIGPGAGLELAGQGVLSDLIGVARSHTPN